MSKSDWKVVNIPVKQFERIKGLCDRSGQSVAFHVAAALETYIAVELPIWEYRLEEKAAEIRKRLAVSGTTKSR